MNFYMREFFRPQYRPSGIELDGGEYKACCGIAADGAAGAMDTGILIVFGMNEEAWAPTGDA